MAIYSTCSNYISSATDLKDKIARYDSIITALEDAALKGASQNDLQQYTLDDGQTKITTVYRDISSTIKAINDFIALRQICINQLNGRVIRLVDNKNFKRYGNF